MKRVSALLVCVLWTLAACQIHHPQLGPNVDRLDTEREQLDDFVAMQKPLSESEDPSVREACTRKVEAAATAATAGQWSAAALDTAIRKCVENHPAN